MRDAKSEDRTTHHAREKSAAADPDLSNEPLISIILFVRNGMPQLERAVNSVLNQSYRNFEYVIQDGGSTDGTVEFLKSIDDPRFKIVSKKDKGPADAFAKAINRCEGEIIASCLADEELAPNALERVVDIFKEYPHLGAITGDADITDLAGNTYAKFTGAPFNLLKYLNGEYCPYWCSSFFSASALRFVGVFDERWSKSSLEFEIWCRLGMETDILYVPEIFSKYAHHADQLSQQNNRVEEELEARIDIIREKMFGRGKYFGDNPGLRDVFTLMQLINIYDHLTVWDSEAAEKALDRIAKTDYLSDFNSLRAMARAPDVEHDVENIEPEGTAAEEVAIETSQGLISDGPLVGPQSRPEQIRSEAIPYHEYILPRRGLVGRVYGLLTPTIIRKMIPRDTKIHIARLIGARRK